ncbi:MAG TPA: NAD(P)-dependent oxidoreductase [Roseiflexaceae bacterium]|nr:NAD(P)-dependent oxidoreductase [Roseiflexaceae bacterium]
MERIGFAGLGRMGQAMAGRLLAAGFPLAVYNRTRAKAEDLLARGAAWAETPALLSERADIVLTILTDDRAVEQVYGGQYGLLSDDCAGKLFVEMSTIRTATIQELRPLVEARGARLLDAPVSGTLEPARQGQLLAMVGGSAEDLDRARPALEVLCRRIAHMGPSGSGTTMKLALNMPMAIFWAGLAEAMVMGGQFGLDRAQMLDVYLDSPVALPALRLKAPLLLGAPHEVAFDVTGVRKDLLAMIATGQDAGVPMPAGSAALALFAGATAAGYGERDLITVVEYLYELVRESFGEL